MDSFSIWFFWALFGAFALQLHGYGSLACLEEEKIGLLKLKGAFKFPNGPALSSWGREQKNCCMWENVKCAFISKRVLELSLNGASNFSSINRDEDRYLDLSLLLPFRELKKLNLAGNFLTGFIGELRSSKLQYLDLSLNRLTEIPPFLSGQEWLKYLNLESNRLTNLSHFKDLTTLSTLEILNLGYNDITGDIPQSISSLTTLKALSFRNNKLIGSLPEDFYTPDVEEAVDFMSKSRFESYKRSILYYMSGIDISQNELSGDIPNELGNLTSIHTLNLSHNHLSGSIPATFSKLKQIQSLDLSFNRLSGEIPLELTQLNFLSVFLVAYNNLSGSIPDRKAQFGTFEESSYAGNPLLCGPPLQRSCMRGGQSPSPLIYPRSGEKESFRYDFLLSFLISYLAAFLGVVSFLYLEANYIEYLVELVRGKLGVFCHR